MRIRIGISTCPNDTYTFHALMSRQIDWRGLDFDVQLLDIQQLNDRLFAADFDVSKASYYAALLLAQQTVVLPSGSALGFGVGPLLLSSQPGTTPLDASQTTLCPGQHTTASMLFQMFYPRTTKLHQVVFSDVMPMLRNRQADFGVCIHEGRFTWQNEGLGLVEDLGTRWEIETGTPLPLGGLVARKSLSETTLQTVQQVIHDSLMFAVANPEAALPTMRRYAQEFSDEVLMKHVDLYVNQWTIDLGTVGADALDQLSMRAVEAGLLPSGAERLRVLGS